MGMIIRIYLTESGTVDIAENFGRHLVDDLRARHNQTVFGVSQNKQGVARLNVEDPPRVPRNDDLPFFPHTHGAEYIFAFGLAEQVLSDSHGLFPFPFCGGAFRFPRQNVILFQQVRILQRKREPVK